MKMRGLLGIGNRDVREMEIIAKKLEIGQQKGWSTRRLSGVCLVTFVELPRDDVSYRRRSAETG